MPTCAFSACAYLQSTKRKSDMAEYSAQIPSATQTSVTGLKWFKIYQDGLTPSDQSWGVDRLIKNKGKVTFTIPSCIPAGQYLLRHELIGKSFIAACKDYEITTSGSSAFCGLLSWSATLRQYVSTATLFRSDRTLSDGVRPAGDYRWRKHIASNSKLPWCLQR